MDDKVNFSSDDIGKKESPNYFVKVEKPSHSFDYYVKNFFKNLWQGIKNGAKRLGVFLLKIVKRLGAFLFTGKRKFITIGVLVAVVLGIIGLVILMKPEPVQFYDATFEELEDARKTAKELYDESPEGYYKAIQMYNDRIEHANTSEAIVNYVIELAKFCSSHGDPHTASDTLERINVSGVSEVQLIDYYAIFAYVEKQLGEEAKSEEYYSLVDEYMEKHADELEGGE